MPQSVTGGGAVLRTPHMYLVVYLACLFAVDPAGFGINVRVANQTRLQPGDERFLQVRPKVLSKGQSAVLSWFNPHTPQILLEQATEASGVAAADRLQPIGIFPARGSLEVRPTITTLYVVSCVDAKVICAESISVTVHE
jgi:hypothetical protein